MSAGVFKKSLLSTVGAAVSPSLFSLTAIAVMLYALKQAEASGAAEGRRILEDSLRRAVVTCYTVEGRYPESLSYIEENYSLSIDSSEYIVFYETEASNVFPRITVFENEEGAPE